MKARQRFLLDFEVDKLTNSIENVVTGDSFRTEVSLLTRADLRIVTPMQWVFDWHKEFQKDDREVHKLTIVHSPSVIQGLTSLTVKEDHVLMHLLESAPFNKGRKKTYSGVPGNLVAFACRLSFQRGNDGFVSFYSKTKLIEHYSKTLGAQHLGGQLMVIDTIAARYLMDQYFKGEDQWG